MTASDSIDFIRLLLDDSRDWFPTMNLVVSSINTAQRRLLQKYYEEQDERALRPFYKTTGWIVPDTLVPDILYPRSCRMKLNVNNADNQTHQITYIEPHLYFNYVATSEAAAMVYPREEYYTIYGNTIANVSGKYFTARLPANSQGGERFKLWYIAEPRIFAFDPTLINSSTAGFRALQFPDEYHPEILTLAAEMLNDIDVGETSRGQMVENRLTIEGVGGG